MKEDNGTMCILNEVGCYADDNLSQAMTDSLTAIEVDEETDK